MYTDAAGAVRTGLDRGKRTLKCGNLGLYGALMGT